MEYLVNTFSRVTCHGLQVRACLILRNSEEAIDFRLELMQRVRRKGQRGDSQADHDKNI